MNRDMHSSTRLPRAWSSLERRLIQPHKYQTFWLFQPLFLAIVKFFLKGFLFYVFMFYFLKTPELKEKAIAPILEYLAWSDDAAGGLFPQILTWDIKKRGPFPACFKSPVWGFPVVPFAVMERKAQGRACAVLGLWTDLLIQRCWRESAASL